MKKQFVFTFLGGALLALGLVYLTAFKGAGQGIKNYALLEIYETPAYSGKGIYIHFGDNNKVEYIPFKEFKADNHDENGEIIVNTVNRMVAQGYHIEHMSSGVAENGMITKIFMHK